MIPLLEDPLVSEQLSVRPHRVHTNLGGRLEPFKLKRPEPLCWARGGAVLDYCVLFMRPCRSLHPVLGSGKTLS